MKKFIFTTLLVGAALASKAVCYIVCCGGNLYLVTNTNGVWGASNMNQACGSRPYSYRIDCLPSITLPSDSFDQDMANSLNQAITSDGLDFSKSTEIDAIVRDHPANSTIHVRAEDLTPAARQFFETHQ